LKSDYFSHWKGQIMFQKLKFKLTNEAPVILHNGQTSDPMNKFSKDIKAISSKRAKTDADYEQMAKIEWYSSLYTDKGRVCFPGECLEAGFNAGARKFKLGKQAQAGLFVGHNPIIEFDGQELTIDQLWERDENRFSKAVRVGQAKVIRTRFIANEWAATVEITYDDELLNAATVKDIVRVTGEQIGLFEWRPKFGRYTAECLG
jgi:hypothetical protein